SASALARQELPGLDVTLRGAVSIARRLLDPLAELVKIDPKSLGVGLYQHDVNPKRLDEALRQVVESCVNFVGVDLNTASPALLRYVSGISKRVAREIVAHRARIGRFTRRSQLLDVPGLGPKTFEQCAGFLRIRSGEEPLDATAVHPESYPVARAILERAGASLEELPAAGGGWRRALRRWIPKSSPPSWERASLPYGTSWRPWPNPAGTPETSCRRPSSGPTCWSWSICSRGRDCRGPSPTWWTSGRSSTSAWRRRGSSTSPAWA